MASTIALSLPALDLSEEESELLNYHLGRLTAFQKKNALKTAYYEGRQRVRMLGISIPPQLRNIETIVGWPGTAVDVLDERLDWKGWSGPTGDDPFGLRSVYLDNDLDVESNLAHHDALVHGTAFVIVGRGEPGEPEVLVTVESPNRVTGEWDGRARRLSSALSIDEVGDDNDPDQITLYLPNENIIISKSGRWGGWAIEDREQHNLGRVTVAQLTNRPRASQIEGRSEITPPIRSYTDQAVRTLLGMEVNREFYSAPQRYALGADEQAFTDKDGNVKTGWEAIMGRMLALPRDEDGELPQVGEFSAASPAPYLDQVQGLSMLVAAEAGMPSTYLGFHTENPASADAIRAAESRLIKRAERRQTGFGRGWREVGALSFLVREGTSTLPAEFREVSNDWTDASTPTRSASADEAVKLIGSQVLTPDSKVTYDRVGLTPQEQRQIENDKRRFRARAAISALAAAAGSGQEVNVGDGGASGAVPTGAE